MTVGSWTREVVAGSRWPLWPTEVEQTARPLFERESQTAGERRRLVALSQLDRYATPVLIPVYLRALEQPSAQVRREVLRRCTEREIHACIPAAASLWANTGETAVRMLALEVLALDPTPTRFAIVVDALRDADEQIRVAAARLIGRAAVTEPLRKHARTALLAKLGDVSAEVRRMAATSLGLVGPDTSTLTLTRLLDDPEPLVRIAAAQALGASGDAKAVPALSRAVAASGESQVSQAAVLALAMLPGETVDELLLALLDDPPQILTREHVAAALARRAPPRPALVEGLVARLREDSLRSAALHVLLQFGESARPALESAHRRGLEPELQLEVTGLLRTLDVPKTAKTDAPAWPGMDQREAWHRALRDYDLVRRERGALELAARSPAWLVDAVSEVFGREPSAIDRDVWLLALVVAHVPPFASTHELLYVRLTALARDDESQATSRCLATFALARAFFGPTKRPRSRAMARSHERSRSTLLALMEHRDASIRACAALAWVRAQTEQGPLTLALADGDPRVRVAASLALGVLAPGRHLDVDTLLGVRAHTDRDAAVRRAAAHALARRSVSPHRRRSNAPRNSISWFAQPHDTVTSAMSDSTSSPALSLLAEQPTPAEPADWYVRVRWHEQFLELPALDLAGHRIAFVPGLEGAVTISPLPQNGASHRDTVEDPYFE